MCTIVLYLNCTCIKCHLVVCFSYRCYESASKLLHEFYEQMTNPKYSAVTDVYAFMFICDLITFLIVVFGYESFGPSVSCFLWLMSVLSSVSIYLPFSTMKMWLAWRCIFFVKPRIIKVCTEQQSRFLHEERHSLCRACATLVQYFELSRHQYTVCHSISYSTETRNLLTGESEASSFNCLKYTVYCVKKMVISG